MDTARAGAQAQAELEAQGIDPESPAEDEDPENPEDAGDESEQEPQAEHPDDSAAAEDEPSPDDERSTQHEQETRSERRQRALQRVTGELEQTKARAQALEGQLHQVRASDSNVINAIQQQAGSEQEFQQLRDTVRRTPEQQQRYEVMVEWRKVAGPIYRTAIDQAYSGLADAITKASEFEGMPRDAAQQLLKTGQPSEVFKLVYEAGQKSGQKALAAENQRLKAEVSSLKTGKVATGRQPASPDGAPANGTSKLPPMLLADGSLNPEFDKIAASGKLYGVERLTG